VIEEEYRTWISTKAELDDIRDRYEKGQVVAILEIKEVANDTDDEGDYLEMPGNGTDGEDSDLDESQAGMRADSATLS
jgi:hypothetical protein